jgi:hypothetical protein
MVMLGATPCRGAEERKVLQLYGALGCERRVRKFKPFKGRMTKVLREKGPETAAEFSTRGRLEDRRGSRLLGRAEHHRLPPKFL